MVNKRSRGRPPCDRQNPDTFAGRLGARLREVRVSAGVTLEQVAERTGLSASSLSDYELGTTEPKLSVFLAICEALNVNPNTIRKGVSA